MLISNFHTHTTRCRHAEGTEREYIENAIKGGLRVLGFSDHAPYVFEGDYYSTFRMRPEALEDYCKTILDLKDEYKNDIEIHLGLEAEYYPRFFDAFLRLIEPYPIEYLIQGQHFIGNELDDRRGSLAGSDDEERLKKYVTQVCRGMETGAFSCLAHPDVFAFSGSEEGYIKHMRELCLCAKKNDIPLEINLLGIRTKRIYPNPVFWKIVGEVGNTVVFGVDAHTAEDVTDNPSFEEAMGMVNAFGLNRKEAKDAILPRVRRV